MDNYLEQLAIEAFGDEDAALRWLYTPHSEFKYLTPVTYAKGYIGHRTVVKHLQYISEQIKVRRELFIGC